MVQNPNQVDICINNTIMCDMTHFTKAGCEGVAVVYTLELPDMKQNIFVITE